MSSCIVFACVPAAVGRDAHTAAAAAELRGQDETECEGRCVAVDHPRGLRLHGRGPLHPLIDELVVVRWRQVVLDSSPPARLDGWWAMAASEHDRRGRQQLWSRVQWHAACAEPGLATARLGSQCVVLAVC